MTREFKAGVYRHYKGNHYFAIGLAREDETEAIVVVYTRLYPREGFPMSTRRLAKWNENIELTTGTVKRFEYVGEQSPAR